MINFKYDYFDKILLNPDTIFNSSDIQLEMIQKDVNLQGLTFKIPKINEIKDQDKLEEYYQFLTLIERKEEMIEIKNSLIDIDTRKIFNYLPYLFTSNVYSVDVYLNPIGYSETVIYIGDNQDKAAIFVNIPSLYKYIYRNPLNAVKFYNRLEKYVFHIIFEQYTQDHELWNMFFDGIDRAKELDFWLMNQGIGELILCGEKYDKLIKEIEQNNIYKNCINQYLKYKDIFKHNGISQGEFANIVMKGINDKNGFISILGYYASYKIYSRLGLEGLKKSINNFDYFQSNGLNQLKENN